MKIIDFLGNIFAPKEDENVYIGCISESVDLNSSYECLAVESSINLIAKTLARAEFQTFDKGKIIKKRNYYMLNIEANKNKSANLFWQETITKLLKEGEALIYIKPNNNEMFLIDNFEVKENVLNGNIYLNLMVGDTLVTPRAHESQVLYLKDNISSVSRAIKGVSKDFSKLISSSIKGYQRSKVRKGKMKVPAMLAKTQEAIEEIQKHIENITREFMDPSKDSILPETNGLEYEEIELNKGSKSNDSGRETKNFINDIFDFIAIAFGIPPSLLKGDTVDTKDALNNFLAFCINPLAKLIQDEINRKLYGYQRYIENSYLKIDTSRVKVVDLRDIANSIDMLVRNGAFTIDDTLKTLGQEPIGGDIGGLRVMTRNNEPIEQFMKGGD